MRSLTVLTLLLLAAAPAGAALSDFEGTWANVDPNTSGLTRLVFRPTGPAVTVQAFGKAHPADSDYGKIVGVAYGAPGTKDLAADADAVLATWTMDFCVRQVVARLDGSGNLTAEEFVRFTDNSGRMPYHSISTLAREQAATPERPMRPSFIHPGVLRPVKPGLGLGRRPIDLRPADAQPTAAEDLINFNPRNIQTVQVGGSWKIVDGSHWLLDFGQKVADARRSFQLIKHYGMNQHGFVGRPNAPFEYWLVNGAAPEGAMPGEDAIQFDPTQLRVELVGSNYTIVEGAGHLMFAFGAEKAQAYEALAIIQKYGFTHSCFVGRPNAQFKYLRK